MLVVFSLHLHTSFCICKTDGETCLQFWVVLNSIVRTTKQRWMCKRMLMTDLCVQPQLYQVTDCFLEFLYPAVFCYFFRASASADTHSAMLFYQHHVSPARERERERELAAMCFAGLCVVVRWTTSIVRTDRRETLQMLTSLPSC